MHTGTASLNKVSCCWPDETGWQATKFGICRGFRGPKISENLSDPDNAYEGFVLQSL